MQQAIDAMPGMIVYEPANVMLILDFKSKFRFYIPGDRTRYLASVIIPKQI